MDDNQGVTYLADFHLHSSFSDGKLPIPDLVDLFGKQGFGAIAITDHFCEESGVMGRAAHYLGKTLTHETLPAYFELLKSEAERAWDRYRMVVLPGIEITRNSLLDHRSAHILGIGVSAAVSPEQDPLQVARDLRAQGALAIAAHPVWTRKIEKQTFHLWDRREELRTEFDAWEVASGPHLFPEVERSRLPKIASSDLHRPSQLSSWKTVLDCERHPEAILRAVRKQQVDFRFYEAPVAATRPEPALPPKLQLQWTG